jgi:hypothetical protein
MRRKILHTVSRVVDELSRTYVVIRIVLAQIPRK